MNQSEKRRYLIDELLKENKEYKKISIPDNTNDQKVLLRSLLNVRLPKEISNDFINVQDEYLREELKRKGIVEPDSLKEVQKDLYIWQGDITLLKVDAIVNAANSGMTGCYVPCHACIDNCIHTFAGVELRNYCADLMEKQGHEEGTGLAKITPGFNLPARFVIHTVGPIVEGKLTDKHKELLKSCYLSCLKIAEDNNVKFIAFCCISTGVFNFPNDEAARIAVDTVKEYKNKNNSDIKVIFNVFKDLDLKIYEDLLCRN